MRPQACSLVGSILDIGLPARFAIDDIAKAVPCPTFELLKLQLLDRSIIDRAGIDLYTGKKSTELKILQVCSLPHHVLSAEIVTALPQHVNRLANLTPHRRPILTPSCGGVCW